MALVIDGSNGLSGEVRRDSFVLVADADPPLEAQFMELRWEQMSDVFAVLEQLRQAGGIPRREIAFFCPEKEA